MQDTFLRQPRKRFGQNFLVDQNIVDKILLAIQPQAADNIVEIGPGRGVLTEPLLRTVQNLQVIEIDRDLCAGLPQSSHLKIFCQDVLEFDFNGIGQSGALRIIGNLPYNISTPLLFYLFRYSNIITDMHFMLQKEVVKRLVATPGNKNYGRLSVMAQYYSDCHKLFEVKAESFKPAPKVTSAFVRLFPRPHREFRDEQETKFAYLVKNAFANRRKTLRNNLKTLMHEDRIRACGIDPSARAESLTVQEFTRLHYQCMI